MRFLLRKLISGSYITASRANTLRHSSSDVQNKTKTQGKTEAAAENSEEVKKNINVEKFGAVTILTIDRQEHRNSLDETTLRNIATAIDAFDKDDKASVLLFHGEGGTFCSGFDIDEMGEKGYNCLKDASNRLNRRPLCDKTTIAAVSGYAVAEGFELALACDLRIIEDTAIMGCLGRRFGVPQSLIGGRRLTALVGLSRALDLLMTGRLINGAEAHQMGLACKLTSTGTALGESVKLAKSLAKFPQNALIMDKLAAVNSQLNPNSEESMRDEAVMNSLLGNAIEDMKEGVKKFQKGIGKHGKFYKLTEMPLKDWELEETFQETIVDLDPPKDPKDAKDTKDPKPKQDC